MYFEVYVDIEMSPIYTDILRSTFQDDAPEK